MTDLRSTDTSSRVPHRDPVTDARGSGRAGAVGLVIGGVFAQQFGAAVASLLFPRAGAAGVVSLRLTLSAVVLLAVCRPVVRGHRRSDWAVVMAFGVALAGMNTLFYQAIARIPLGAAVTLEVLGPLVLSVVTARRKSGWLWAALALTGVALLGRGGLDGLNLTGSAFALGAAAMWAAYIVLSARTGSRFPKADGLALAMGVGALVSLPAGVLAAGSALVQPVSLGLGAAVALLSSVFPYTLELLALRRLHKATFAVLMSLAPAVAATAGFLVLDQDLAAPEILAILLVVTASAGAVRASTNPAPTGRRDA
ncbi:EamA family transporter [Streptomyces sp. NPDC002306]